MAAKEKRFDLRSDLSPPSVCPASGLPRRVATKKHGLGQEVPEGRCVGVGHPSSPDRCAEHVVCLGRPFIPQDVPEPGIHGNIALRFSSVAFSDAQLRFGMSRRLPPHL